MKHTAFLLSILSFLIFLLFFPQMSLAYAKSGLMLWFYTLLPSMLPFLILSNISIRTNILDHLLEAPKNFWQKVFCLSPYGAYALMMGIFCGYPMGAKITADLYKEHHITKQEACYLLTFVNHPGPSFLSAYICIGIFHRAHLITTTYIIIYTSSFLCSLFFRFYYLKNSPILFMSSPKSKKEISAPYSFGEILDISIMNGFESITKLGGYIILFSILQGILKQLLHTLPDLKYLILGLTEITTGISMISETSWPLTFTYPLILSLTSFGGLCVAAQTKSMLSGTDLPITPYLKGKVMAFGCTAVLSWFLVKIIKIVV